MSTEANTTQNSPVEVVKVKGNKLIETVKSIMAKGNVSRVLIYWANGDKLLDIPYVAGLTATAVVTFFIPVIALFTPIALLLGRFQIEIVRPEAEADAEEVPAAPSQEVETPGLTELREDHTTT